MSFLKQLNSLLGPQKNFQEDFISNVAISFVFMKEVLNFFMISRLNHETNRKSSNIA